MHASIYQRRVQLRVGELVPGACEVRIPSNVLFLYVRYVATSFPSLNWTHLSNNYTVTQLLLCHGNHLHFIPIIIISKVQLPPLFFFRIVNYHQPAVFSPCLAVKCTAIDSNGGVLLMHTCRSDVYKTKHKEYVLNICLNSWDHSVPISVSAMLDVIAAVGNCQPPVIRLD